MVVEQSVLSAEELPQVNKHSPALWYTPGAKGKNRRTGQAQCHYCPQRPCLCRAVPARRVPCRFADFLEGLLAFSQWKCEAITGLCRACRLERGKCNRP